MKREDILKTIIVCAIPGTLLLLGFTFAGEHPIRNAVPVDQQAAIPPTSMSLPAPGAVVPHPALAGTAGIPCRKAGTSMIVHQGDITRMQVDAIVNAANPSLLGGGGVDGAIHAAAGPGLLDECRTLGGCPRGEARITRGYNLPARHVIHTVGPVWNGGLDQEDDVLESCYRNSLALAERNGVRTIAFPAISTGVYGFPKDRAAAIAVRTTQEYMATHSGIERVIFVCHNGDEYQIYRENVDRIAT
jgi:O-acetyl-ADP-ribose deacetylase (regulator of RNase III)